MKQSCICNWYKATVQKLIGMDHRENTPQILIVLIQCSWTFMHELFISCLINIVLGLYYLSRKICLLMHQSPSPLISRFTFIQYSQNNEGLLIRTIKRTSELPCYKPGLICLPSAIIKKCYLAVALMKAIP